MPWIWFTKAAPVSALPHLKGTSPPTQRPNNGGAKFNTQCLCLSITPFAVFRISDFRNVIAGKGLWCHDALLPVGALFPRRLLVVQSGFPHGAFHPGLGLSADPGAEGRLWPVC